MSMSVWPIAVRVMKTLHVPTPTAHSFAPAKTDTQETEHIAKVTTTSIDVSYDVTLR